MYVHRKRLQNPQNQEPQRGRSRTPKPTALAVESAEQGRHRHLVHKRISSDPTVQIPRSPRSRQVVHRPTRPPPKGKSPDRSEPGALEDAIHEAYARGDLRQCLQWVLEMQGVYLDWDDPRLDTVTEDDLCFSEQTGMGPNATPEERERAEKYWAMRQAEEDDARRAWELTASQTEKEASGRLREKYEAEQRKREARAQFFRAPRRDKAVPAALSSQRPPRPPAKPSTLSHSLDSALDRPYTIPRTSRSRPKALFPADESELSAVRSMWLDQGRKGLALVEVLVQPPTEPPLASQDATESASFPKTTTTLDRSGSSDSIEASTSASTSLSSAHSALFSSVLTTSTATSVSTVPCSSPTSTSPVKSASSSRTRQAAATSKPTPVSTSECPLHTHLVSVSLRRSLEEDEVHRHKESTERNPERPAPRRQRTVSTSWLSRGSKTVGGLVDLVGRLPTAYLPPTEHDASPLRTASCPPSTRLHPAFLPPSPSESETFIHLLPLRPPSHPLTFPPLPTLPRSPYRPPVPPPHPTPRPRFVPNPQFLRLKALQNRVLWGLVPVPRAECDVLADIVRRHHADSLPGRPDVDRYGQMFTTKEALLRFAVEGAGLSALSDESRVVVGAPEESMRMWSWWRGRG